MKLYYNAVHKKYGIMTAIDVLDRYLNIYVPGLKNIRELSPEEAVKKITDENYEFTLNEKRWDNMKLYRNYTKSDDGIMTAEEVLDRYLERNIWGMSNIARISEREVAIMVLDEGYKLTTTVKDYLVKYVESKSNMICEMHIKDWGLAVMLLMLDNKQD